MVESAKYESGASLLEALESGEAAVASEDAFVGLVKASESEGNVAFTPGSCDEWIDIPADLVGNVEVLEERIPCGGQFHPRVRMQLKLDAGDPMHAAVRQLLNVAATRGSRLSMRARRPSFGGFGRFGLGRWGLRPPRLGVDDGYWVECISYCADGGVMVCVCWASDGEVWSEPCGSC